MNPNLFWEAPGVARIGWVLVHFVWQGVLLALACALLLRLMRPAAARARYLAALGGLLCMAAVPPLTFILSGPVRSPAEMPPSIPQPAVEFFSRIAAGAQGEPVSGASQSLSRMAAPMLQVVQQTESALQAQQPASASPAPVEAGGGLQLEERLERLLPWLVLVWLLGVVILSVRQMTAWRLTHRLRRRWVKPVAPQLRETLARLAQRMGVNRAVGLLESAVIEVPSMIGWFKPLILLPASALTGLPSAQIEQILAHELAHVRRHDYLVNLFQTMIETLLFYHPAVWWLGRRVRELREHCCDDLVVEVLGDAHGYASALTRMEELRVESSEFAMALTGGTLMERIRRILGMKERETNGDRWFAGLVTMALVAMAGGWMLLASPNPALAAGEMEAAIADEMKTKPGYVDLQALKLLENVEPEVEIMLPKVLLNMTLNAAKKSHPDIAELTDGLNLELLQIKVYENLGDNVAAVRQKVTEQIGALLKSGWLPIVRVPEENVNILLRVNGDKLLGGIVLVAPENELVFVNVVGDIDSTKLGEKAGLLLNKAISGEFNLEDLMKDIVGGFGPNKGDGDQAPAGPPLTPTGFKTNLEVESMELSGASISTEPSLGPGRAVRMDRSDGRISGSIKLEPGIYKAWLWMNAPDLDHDAVVLQIDDKASMRVHCAGDHGWGRSHPAVQFELNEARDVPVVINGAESGMLLDRVEFEQFRTPAPAPAPAPIMIINTERQ